MSETTKGPASYFPAIEAEYGQPIAHWQRLLRGHTATRVLVAWLVAAVTTHRERPPHLGRRRLRPVTEHRHPL